MKTKFALLSGIAVFLTGALLVAGIPAEADAEVIKTDETSVSSAHHHYSDLDMIELLVFGRGPIAEEHPDLVVRLNITPQLDASEATMNVVLADLKSVDERFHERVTLNAQANDPYKAEEAIANLNEDVLEFAKNYEEASSGQAIAARASASTYGSVWAFSNYVMSTQVAVTAAAAVSVLAVALALAVLVYQRSGDGSELISDGYAADLSRV